MTRAWSEAGRGPIERVRLKDFRMSARGCEVMALLYSRYRIFIKENRQACRVYEQE